MVSLAHYKIPLMAVALLAHSVSSSGQDLRDAARRQALRDPNGTVEVPAPPGHYTPKSIEQLRSESIAVVTGKLVRKQSYLGSSEDRVLTDYNITDVQVVAGTLSLPSASIPGPAALPVLTVWGGETVVEGVRVRAANQNFEGAIKAGVAYLLFLRSARPPAVGRYEIYHGGIFEIGREYVTPLLKGGNAVFPWASDLSFPEVIASIRTSGKWY